MVRPNSAGVALVVLFVIVAVAAISAGGCSLMNLDSDRLRVERVQAAVLPMAEVALQSNQLETAGRLYRRLLDVDSESFRARMGLGVVALRRREAVDAARWYADALAAAQTPEQRHEALLAHGRAALEAGQLEDARHSFSQLTDPDEQVPQNSVAWGFNGVGLILLLQGDLPGAVEQMQQAVRWGPAEAMFQENLARVQAMAAERQSVPADVETAAAPAQAAPETARAPVEPAAEPPSGPSPPSIAASEPDAAVAAASAQATPETARAPVEPAVKPPTDLLSSSMAIPEPDAATAVAESPLLNKEQDPVTQDGGEVASLPAAAPDEAAKAASAGDDDSRGFIVREDGEQFVQLGAYAVRARAESLAARLRNVTDVPVHILDSPSPLYRVRVGPIDSPAALSALSATLEGTGYGSVRSVASDQDAAAAAGQSAGRQGRPLVVTAPEGRFMQFGAYRARATAETLALRLRGLIDEPVEVTVTQPNDAPLHRVRAGPIESDESLHILVEAAESIGFAVD